jgi:hypothetical protein
VARIELERIEAIELLGLTLAHLNDTEGRAEVVTPRAAADGNSRQARYRAQGGTMSYTDAEVSAATAAMDKYWGTDEGESGAALVVVGLSAERAAKEVGIRDDMIRVAHRTGASIRQLAEASGLGRKTVTAIIAAQDRLSD